MIAWVVFLFFETEGADRGVHRVGGRQGRVCIRGGMKTMVAQEAAFAGMLVTGKGNGAIATIKREWGVKRNLRRDKLPLIMDMVLSLGALLYEKRTNNI